VTMSARFPLLSSSGGLRSPDGSVIERVLDGGFLESFGATTAAEVGRYLTYTFPPVQKGQYQTIPIVITISSDPTLTAGFTNSPCDAIRDPIAQAKCLGVKASDEHPILDALDSLFSGRGSHGQASVFQLRNLVAELRELLLNRLVDRAGLQREEVSSRLGGPNDRVDFFHFRLCTAEGLEPLLSWRLSEGSLDIMDAALGLNPKAPADGADRCGNRIQFFRLCVRLARLTGQAENDPDATTQCSARWPRPERWRCTPTGIGDRTTCDIAPGPRSAI